MTDENRLYNPKSDIFLVYCSDLENMGIISKIILFHCLLNSKITDIHNYGYQQYYILGQFMKDLNLIRFWARICIIDKPQFSFEIQ